MTIRKRLVSWWNLKIGIWLALAVGICIPYFSLQRIGLSPIPTLPISPIDDAIPFTPEWIWVYVSLAILVPLAPSLATSRDQLFRYARGLAMLCTSCFVVFWLLPVAGPRPELMPQHDLYRFIVSVDRPTNSLPSLHAGLTAYSLLFAWRVMCSSLDKRQRMIFGLGAAVWGSLILYSTLATKQHWLVDLPAGVLIAWAADQRAWRGVEKPQKREDLALPTR